MAKIKLFLRELIPALLALSITLTALYQCGTKLLPTADNTGVVWHIYKKEAPDSIDVLYFGSSLAYCGIIPGEIYHATGITGYVMAGPRQTLPVTYSYLREACRTQKPKVAFLEVTGVFYPKTTEYSLTNVLNLPMGKNRIAAALQCEPGILRSALFPLYETHWRIFDNPATPPAADPYLLCGYVPLTGVQETPVISQRTLETKSGDACYENNLAYLAKIANFCQEQGIQLVCYLSPVLQQVPQIDRELLAQQLSAMGLQLVDWTELAPSLDVKMATDWYDTRHFNRLGALKFSAYLADYLQGLGLTATSGLSAETEALWQQRATYTPPE